MIKKERRLPTKDRCREVNIMKKDLKISSIILLAAFLIYLLSEYLFNYVFIGEEMFYRNLYIKKNFLVPIQFAMWAASGILALIMSKRYGTRLKNIIPFLIRPLIFMIGFVILFKIINAKFLECFSVFIRYIVYLIIFFAVFNTSSSIKNITNRNLGEFKN